VVFFCNGPPPFPLKDNAPHSEWFGFLPSPWPLLFPLVTLPPGFSFFPFRTPIGHLFWGCVPIFCPFHKSQTPFSREGREFYLFFRIRGPPPKLFLLYLFPPCFFHRVPFYPSFSWQVPFPMETFGFFPFPFSLFPLFFFLTLRSSPLSLSSFTAHYHLFSPHIPRLFPRFG